MQSKLSGIGIMDLMSTIFYYVSLPVFVGMILINLFKIWHKKAKIDYNQERFKNMRRNDNRGIK